ncbi:hypothetical protein EQK42_32090 [Streptomyces albidoflavus]|uniref:hypothetical protein n=1 Tax=Streptomyces albidoflavus TaxID=1886 RepID=UPI000FF3EB1D|nr:hypothetical protein [Streptomyces albidoflavus]RWZ69171.1 hypothetical protein EQK42_32090 [Streptomyces albidoflavus]
MSEPTRYQTGPVELPLRLDPEPAPVDGCPYCTELARVRSWARAGGDMTTVSDYNVFLRRHPEGHR